MRAILRYLALTAIDDTPLIQSIDTDVLKNMSGNEWEQFIAAFTTPGKFKEATEDPDGGNADKLITNLSNEQLANIHKKCLEKDAIKKLLTTETREINHHGDKAEISLLNFCTTALGEFKEELLAVKSFIQALAVKGMESWLKTPDLCSKIDSAQLHPGRRGSRLTPFGPEATKQIRGKCFMQLKNFEQLTDDQIKAASEDAFTFVDRPLPAPMYALITKEQIENFDKEKEADLAKVSTPKPDEFLEICKFLHPLALESNYTANTDAPTLRPHCVNGLLAAYKTTLDPKAHYGFAQEILDKPENKEMFSEITKDGSDALDMDGLVKSNEVLHFTNIVARVFGPNATDDVSSKLCEKVIDLRENFLYVPYKDVMKLPIRCLIDSTTSALAFNESQVQRLGAVLDGTDDDASNKLLAELLKAQVFMKNVSVEQFERLKKTMLKHKDTLKAEFGSPPTLGECYFLIQRVLNDLNEEVAKTITSECLKTMHEREDEYDEYPISENAAKKLPPQAFRSIGAHTLDDFIFENMSADQLAVFDADIPDADPSKCKTLKLKKVGKKEIKKLKFHSVNSTCFLNILEQYDPSDPLNLPENFAKIAGDDLFDALEFEHLQRLKLSRTFDGFTDRIWNGAQPAHLRKLITLIDDQKLSTVAAYGVSHAFRANNGVELIKGKDWQDYPVTFLLNDNVLASLGSKFIMNLNRPLNDRYAYKLFKHAIIRKYLSKDQFETIMSDNDYASCANYTASTLYGLNKKALEAVHHRCISKLVFWEAWMDADQLRAVIPHLSETAFASFQKSFSDAATKLMSSAQLSHFGEQDDISRCKSLKLEHVSYGSGISARCFENAVKKAPLSRKFFHTAPDDIFAEVTDPVSLAVVLKDGKDWSFLRQKQLEGLLALRDGIMCKMIKVPDAGMSLQLPSNFGPDCVEAMESSELEKLLASDAIHRLDPNILSRLTSRHAVLATTLASLASRRAVLLSAFGRTALPNICERYKVQDAPQLDIALKHLPTECLSAFHGISAITSPEAFLKLPPPLQGVVRTDELVAKINFRSIKLDTLARLAAAENICQHFPADKLRLVKDWLVHLKAKCISTLSFPLTSEELARVNVSDVTPDFVRQYFKQLSKDQMGKLTTNAQGIPSLGDLSVEQVTALAAVAIPHILPAAFTSVDATRLTAFSPDAIAATRLDQASQIDKCALSRLTSKQAPRLQPAVASLLDTEIRASMDPEIVQLLPQSGAMSILASMRTAMAVLVTLVLALWVV